MEKICTKCCEVKPYSEFNKNKAKPDGMQSNCRDCCKLQTRNHYSENKAYYKRKAVVRNNAERVKIMDEVYGYLALHPCVDCGEADIVVLQFDHLNNKTDSVARMIATYVSWERIQVEIAKCEVVCANCHTRRTAKQFKWYKLDFQTKQGCGIMK